MKKNILFITLLFLVGVLFLNSCTTTEEVSSQTRLFRPVLNHDLLAENNTITVDMGKLKEAVYYKIEISRDTFKTVLKKIDTPENKYVFNDLLWNTLYQVRATAIAANEEFNSKISDFGGVKTEKFPSILLPAASNDVTDISAKVRWTVVAGDQTITSVKVFAAKDEELATPLASYVTTPAEQTAGQKIIAGLTPGTKYQLAIYSGATIRGWDFYTTKPAIPTTGNVIDLRGISNPDILMTTLKDPATVSGSTIILDGDMAYNGTSYSFDRSITIKSGYSLDSAGAIINVKSNFNLAANSVISSIIFDGITFKSADAAAIYIFNVNTNGATVEDLKFDNCRISSFRGILRAQGAANVGRITNYTINNSIVTDIRGYGVITLEPAGWKFSTIAFTNSTFYKCEKLITASAITTPAKSILISDCTLNEETLTAGKIFVFPATAAGNVTDGITITNTIIGRAWDKSGVATTWGIDPIDGLTSTNFTVTNSFATSEYTLTATGTPIPGFPNFTYSKKMTDLWKDPANGDFNFIDSSFQGIKTSGDPRWRKQ